MRQLIGAVTALFLLAGASAQAHGTAESVQAIFDQPLPTVPGKSLIAVEVNYAPGAGSPAHRHPGSAFIMAYVVSGAIRSQVDQEPVRVYQAGETWHELPGAHHVVSENASKTEAAKLLAVFVVDSKDQPLVRPDAAK